ncbi:hypothetical protein TYRP_003696 [Tyrophagus putrescentiae]|nr:hypothetical protein TYRP_003696 [Tyrophagus putrescentiae]
MPPIYSKHKQYDDPPFSESEIAHMSEKYNKLFAPGKGLPPSGRLGRILDDLEGELKLGQLVPEAAQLDDVHWDAVEQCYDALLLTDHSTGSVNLFNSTLKRVVKMYFDFHLDLLEDGQAITILRRLNHLMANIYHLARETIQCVRDVRERRGEPTKLGLTPFAAYSDEEFAEKFLMKLEDLDITDEKDYNYNIDEGGYGGDKHDRVKREGDDDDDDEEEEEEGYLGTGAETLGQQQPSNGGRRKPHWRRTTRRPGPNPRPHRSTESPPYPGPDPDPKNVEWPRKTTCKVTVPQAKWPARYDWRDYKLSGGRSYSVVTPVKQQGRCGSCYVFAGVAAMESAFMLSNENKEPGQTVFSEQALLNCQRGGCRGGFPTEVWRGAQRRGVTLAANSAYVGHPEQCRNFPSKARPTSFCQNRRLRSDADIIGVVYQFGPAAIAINGHARSMKLLRGTWNNRDCSRHVDHVVTVVGYTEDTFIMKNSWGKGFGKDGYLILKRDNTNRCGIYTEIELPFFNGQDKGYNT